MTDAELTGVAIHEIVHALIEPIVSVLNETQIRANRKLNELATENVARAIQHLMEATE